MYTSGNSLIVRIGFRIVFFVLSVYLGAVGSYCNKLSLKLRLLRNGRVPMQDAAGWVSGTAIFEPIYRSRRIPNFKWWSLMAAVLVLVKINDLITNTIRTLPVPSLCAFGYGMVMSKTGFDTFLSPPWNSRSQLVAGNAQITSQGWGCQQGIYKKVNWDSTFCAAEIDIIGGWECASVGNNLTYTYGTEPNDVLGDLQDRGLFYAGDVHDAITSQNSLNWTHLIAWNSNVEYENQTGIVFEVKAAIDTTALETDKKIMHSMHCKVQGNDQVYEIVKSVPSYNALSDWSLLLQGYMYEGYASYPVTDPEFQLAWLLNTMTMVAGGSDMLFLPAPADDPYQGCLIDQTYIPPAVLAFLALTLLSCAGMTASTFLFWFRLRRHHDRSQVEYAPIDRWGWMGQAAAESSAAAFGPVYPVKSQDLSLWSVVRDPGPTVRLVKEHSEAVLLNPVYPKQEQEPAFPAGLYTRETAYPGH